MPNATKELLAGFVATLLLAAPAAAAPGEGAEAFKYEYCQADDLTTFCAKGHSVYQTTETPSGNVKVVVNTSYYYSVSAPDCNYDNTGQDHYTYLLTPEEFQQSHTVQSFDFHSSCFGTVEHCTFYNNIAFANGEVRAEKSEYVCEPA